VRDGRRIEVVAFDLDNTLYDEDQYFAGAFATIAPLLAARCGLESDAIAARLWAILRREGRHHHRLFNDLLAELGLPERPHLADLLGAFRDVSTPLEPFPGVRELLRDLGASYRLGLITSGMRAVQRNKLRLLRLEEAFERVVYSSTLGENKPGQRPFRVLLEAMGVSPARAVYVGDNPRFDFKGANELGMLTVRIRTPEFEGTEVAAGWDGQVRLPGIAALRSLLL
jgi:putative hydrolase of the HAD superfamily